MIPSLSIGPRTLLNDCNHSATAKFWRSAISQGFDGKGPGLRQELFLFSRRLNDADWAGDHETRSSTTGFTFIFGGAAVIWGSNLQKTVALSTEEAE